MYQNPVTSVKEADERWSNTSNVSQTNIGIDFVNPETIDSDAIQTTDALQVFLNEIDIMLDVEGFDKALYHRLSNAATYQNAIQSLIKQNSICQEWFEWSVEVQLSQGERRDIMVITILITKRFDKVENFSPIYKQYII